MYQNFTTVKALKVVELEVDIETPTDAFTIILNADVDLNGGFEKLGVDGTLSVLIDDQQLDIDIRYTDGVVYIDVLNGKYMIETSNIMESINQILSILNIEMPDLGMSLGSLDLDSILAMLSDLTEIKGENNITLSINVPVIGSLSLVCDLNYSVRELNLPKTEISEGTTISVASKFDYPSSVTVDTPTEPEYINATHLFTVLGSALDYLNQEEIGFDIDAKYSDYSFAGNFSASIKEFNSKFTTNLLGYDLNLVAIDNILYFEYGNLNLKFALADANLLSSLLYEQFGLDLPLDEIISILTSLKNGNLMEIIPSLNFGESKGSTNLSDIDLSIIQSFIKNGDVYTLTLRDIGEINFGVKENKLVSLGFTGFGADALLSMVSPRKVSLTSDNYLDLKDTLPTLNALISTIKQNSFVGSAVILNKDEAIGSMSYAINKNNFAAHIEISVYGQVISLDLLGSTIYLKIKDMGVYLSIEDADSIKSFLSDNFNIAMEGFDLNKFIDQVLEILNPNINPSFIKSMTKTENGLTITVFNDLTISIDHADTISSMAISFGDIKANLTLTASQEDAILPSINEGDYQPLDTLLNAITETKKYIENKQFYLSFDLNYDKYFASGSANYDENGISAYASANIDGNNIELRFIDETIYLDISGLKISFALRDIDTVSNFVYEKFGFDINKMINDVKNKLQNTSTGDFNLQEFITNLNIVLNATSLDIVSPDFSLTLKFQDMLKGLSVNASGLTLNANIESKPSVIETTGEYFNITEILPFIDIVMKSVETKQFDLTADAKVYEGKTVIFETTDAELQLNLNNGLQFYGNVEVIGKTNHAMELSVYGDYLYFNYNGLLIKISNKDVNELLVLVMNMLGIDPSILPALGDVANGMDINTSNMGDLLGGMMPSTNPLDIINIFKSISVNGNTLDIVLDGSKISTNERAENMFIQLVTDGEKLVSLDLKNLYTGVSNNEHFDLHVDFNSFTEVKSPDTTKNYIDISGSNEIIKAALNMTSYRDFEIAGNFDVDMSIPVLSDMHMSMPVSFKVKIVDGKPEVMIVIDKIPVAHPLVYNLNNDTNWKYNQVNTLNIATMKSSGETRKLSIYYKDGEVYFYRHELNTKGATYEKKLKAPLETVMSDILYYVQWGTGFNDDIIGAIRKSLANEHEVDLGNIIRSFNYDDVNDICTIVLNMTEISGDKNMGDMTIGLRLTDHNTIANGENVAKKIIGLIDFKMNMPFTDSIQLNMQTNADDPLRLENLGQVLDFTDFYNYINSYEYEDNIEWEAYNNKWIKASEREFIVNFVTNQPDLSEADIKGKQGTTFALPEYSTVEYRTETEYSLYKFMGWYSSSSFNEGTEVTEGIIPKNNMTLYARWDAVELYRTVNFYVDGVLKHTMYELVGTTFDNSWLPQTIQVEDGDNLLTKVFTGWVDDEGYKISYVPEDSVDLFAVYTTVDELTLTRYTLSFDTSVGKTLDPVREFNSYSVKEYLNAYDTNDVVINKDGVTTTYAFRGWYTDSEFNNAFDGIMPECDTTIYAKWDIIGIVYERAINIYDNGELVYSDKYAVGEEITLPSTIKLDENTLWYLDGEYSTLATLPEIMPDNDVNLHIRNMYTVSYTYYENIDGVHTQKSVQETLYQGETFILPQQNDYEINYDLDGNGEKDKLIAYTFDGYLIDKNKVNNTIIVPNRNIIVVSNLTTIEANWCKMSFHYEWVKPQGSPNTWTSKTVDTQDFSIFVLEGSTLNGINLTYRTSLLDTTDYTRELSASCSGRMGIEYNYHAIGYNNSGCVNYGINKGTAQSMTVTKSDIFYVEWDD